MAKNLVAYFSASGSTARLAQTLAAAADAALYEIRPAVPYQRGDLNWMDKKARSTVEMADPNCRVAMADSDAPVADADVIFLGFPNWWGTAPMPVFTFLDAFDFSGKKIAPFCTNEGSGMGSSENDIRKECPGANVLSGLSIRGSDAGKSETKAAAWAKQVLK